MPVVVRYARQRGLRTGQVGRGESHGEVRLQPARLTGLLAEGHVGENRHLQPHVRNRRVRGQSRRSAGLRGAECQSRRVGCVAQFLGADALEMLLRQRPVAASIIETWRQFGQPCVARAEDEPAHRRVFGEGIDAGRDAREQVLQLLAIGRDLLVGVPERGEIAGEVRGRVGRAERQPALPRGDEHPRADQEQRDLPRVLGWVG